MIPQVTVTHIARRSLNRPIEMHLLIRGESKKKKDYIPKKCKICKSTIKIGEEYLCGNGLGCFCVGCVDFE
jgi:hypothetical protein